MLDRNLRPTVAKTFGALEMLTDAQSLFTVRSIIMPDGERVAILTERATELPGWPMWLASGRKRRGCADPPRPGRQSRAVVLESMKLRQRSGRDEPVTRLHRLVRIRGRATMVNKGGVMKRLKPYSETNGPRFEGDDDTLIVLWLRWRRLWKRDLKLIETKQYASEAVIRDELRTVAENIIHVPASSVAGLTLKLRILSLLICGAPAEERLPTTRMEIWFRRILADAERLGGDTLPDWTTNVGDRIT